MGNTELSEELISTLNDFNSSHSLFNLSLSNIASLVVKLQATINDIVARERLVVQQEADTNKRIQIINGKELKMREDETKLAQQQHKINQQEQEIMQKVNEMVVNKTKMTNKIKLNVGMMTYHK